MNKIKGSLYVEVLNKYCASYKSKEFLQIAGHIFPLIFGFRVFSFIHNQSVFLIIKSCCATCILPFYMHLERKQFLDHKGIGRIENIEGETK